MNFFKKNKQNNVTKKVSKEFNNAYYMKNCKATWMDANYENFSNKGYIKNVIVNKAISTIARNVASNEILLYNKDNQEIKHPVISKLIQTPNPVSNMFDLLENIVMHLYISGNAYLNFIAYNNQLESYLLRPDRVKIKSGNSIVPNSYEYVVDKTKTIFEVDPENFKSPVCHIKFHNPLNDFYGLSPIETAQYSMEQHNQCLEWNKSLLENGARPTGALVLNGNSHMSDEEFDALKTELRSQLSGTANAGQIMILEGGITWQEMSINPKDMDFIATKNSAARDIALALDIPPQILGIQGDNTYSNFSEARIAFWEETIIPLSEKIMQALTRWININIDETLTLKINYDKISALQEKRQKMYQNLQSASFLTDEEKRKEMGW
jgi:HK97 family phage portal protein